MKHQPQPQVRMKRHIGYVDDVEEQALEKIADMSMKS
jgi:hypothetical protein